MQVKVLALNMSQEKKFLKQHSNQRAKERVGISLHKAIRATIIKGILNNRYETIQDSGNRKQFRITDIGNKIFNVVYDFTCNEIVTVLNTYRDSWEDNHPVDLNQKKRQEDKQAKRKFRSKILTEYEL